MHRLFVPTILSGEPFLLARGKQSAMEFVETKELGRQWLQAQHPLMVKAAVARSLELQKAQAAGSKDD